MTDPTERESAQAWAAESGQHLACLSAPQRREFFFKVLASALREWPPGLTASSLHVFSPKYALAVAKKMQHFFNLYKESCRFARSDRNR